MGYSEDLPSIGYVGCTNGYAGLPLGETYARKHSPWVDFSNLPSTVNVPFTSFPKDYNKLPTLSFVIPNLNHDMHNGSIQLGDTWLRDQIDPYAQWAKTHNSLLIVTWDEDDQSEQNRVSTFIVGANIRTGIYNESVNHYGLLRTVEDLYDLPHLGQSASATPITDIWNSEK
jgi:phosphatidylinositol-3-phosphatase